jgi:hypothetical protein
MESGNPTAVSDVPAPNRDNTPTTESATAQYCPWAEAYVKDQVARGKKRSSAYRSLAFKWQMAKDHV